MNEAERYIKRQTARRVILTAKADLDKLIEAVDKPGCAFVDSEDLERISRALDNALNSLIGT